MLVFVVDAVKTAIDFSGKSAKIESERQKVEALKKENKSLEKMLEKVKSPRFVEEEARNKLNMSLPGDITIIGE